MTSGVYFIKSPSGKMYIGSSVNVNQRVGQHFINLRAGRHVSKRLMGAWAKYGGEGFTHGVLEMCPEDVLIEREQHWLDTLKPNYNVRMRAGDNQGLPASDEQRAAASEVGKRPETIARLKAANEAAWADPAKRQARIDGMKAVWTSEKREAASAKQKGIDKGQAAREARWSAPGASERAAEAMRANHATRPSRSVESITEAVLATGYEVRSISGHKVSDRVLVHCPTHNSEQEYSVHEVMNKDRRCRACGFERSSAKQKGKDVPTRQLNRKDRHAST